MKNITDWVIHSILSMFYSGSHASKWHVLPESAPTWQCWGLRWTSDGWGSRWDTGLLSSHSVGLPPAPPLPSWRFSAPAVPASISPSREPWRSSACRLCGTRAAAPPSLAGTPPAGSGLPHCPAIRTPTNVSFSEKNDYAAKMTLAWKRDGLRW